MISFSQTQLGEMKPPPVMETIREDIADDDDNNKYNDSDDEEGEGEGARVAENGAGFDCGNGRRRRAVAVNFDELPDVDDDESFEAFVARASAAEYIAVLGRHQELVTAIAWLEVGRTYLASHQTYTNNATVLLASI